MESKRKELEIKVKKGTLIDQISTWCSQIKKSDGEYHRFVVNYKTSLGNNRSALAQEKEDAFDFAFGRVEIVNLSTPIESSSLKEIHPELNEEMKKLLIEERK